MAGLIDGLAAHAAIECVKGELRGVQFAVHAVVFRHVGMHLAQDAQQRLAAVDLGTAAG